MNKAAAGPLDGEQACERALYFLEYRAHSRHELVEKLCRLTDRETAEGAADKMAQAGLIDDEAFAFQLAHDLIDLKMIGPSRLRRELAQHGIDDEVAENAVWAAEAELGAPQERLEKLIRLKYLSALDDEKARKRTVDALFRLGYRYDMIKAVIYAVTEGLELESEDIDGTD